ncbi:MAG: AraC family transcriptional regulator [Cyclobacteriaceae bacterium]|nr:AraC family transcriptional regulator [Cyclobacteriaceae bacterium HetDA_MAG_MS6]
MKEKSNIPFYNLSDASDEHREEDQLLSHFAKSGIQIFTNKGLKESFEPNRLDFYVVALNRHGSAKKDIGLINYDLVPGTIHFLSPGTLHTLSNLSEDIDGFYICFRKAFYDEHYARQSWLENLPYYAFDGVPLFQPNPKTFDELEKLCFQMHQEQTNPQSDSNDIIWSCLHHMHLIANRDYLEQFKHQRIESVNRNVDLLTERFKKLVDAHFVAKKQVAEYADELAISPQYLSEIIHENTGASPLYWIHKRTFLEAKYCFIHTDLSIKEISNKLDFSSPAHFSKFFKKMTNGLSPSQFLADLKN